MKRKQSFIPFFIIFFVISLLIYIFSGSGFVGGLSQLTRTISSPFSSLIHSIFISGNSSEIAKITEEKDALLQKLVQLKEVEKENKALRDQFETTYPASYGLIPAKVIGAPAFIPGIQSPETIIIDKGKKNNIRVGQGVVVKNNLIGKIEKVTNSAARVILISNPATSLKVKTVSTNTDSKPAAIGLLKGQGNGAMVLDNVLLSEQLQPKDTIVTFGDQDENGHGIPPDLVIGTVVSVEKKPSAVFQKAEVKSVLNVSSFFTVFVIGELNE